MTTIRLGSCAPDSGHGTRRYGSRRWRHSRSGTGDHYGSTVIVAARIAAYAQPGEVIVSQAMVDASGDAAVAFRDVGPVELKGVADAMRLFAATRVSVSDPWRLVPDCSA